DQAGGTESQIKQTDHAAAREGACELFQRFEFSRRKAPAHQRTDGRARNDISLDASAGKRFQHADMGPAARHAGAERDADFRTRHLNLLHTVGCSIERVPRRKGSATPSMSLKCDRIYAWSILIM